MREIVGELSLTIRTITILLYELNLLVFRITAKKERPT